MADITTPAAIKFTNEVIRPLCERSRALCAEIDAATTQWFGGMNNNFPNDSSPLVDGRAAEGVSQLTGTECVNAVANLMAMKAASNAEILSKPCVRPMQVITPA